MSIVERKRPPSNSSASAEISASVSSGAVTAKPRVVELGGQVVPVEGVDACFDSHPRATHDETRV